MKRKKFNTGGQIYQPVGQLVSPQQVLDYREEQDRLNSSAAKIAKISKALLPLAGSLVAGPVGGMVGSGISRGIGMAGYNAGGPILPPRDATNMVNPLLPPVISPMSTMDHLNIAMRDGLISRTQAVNSYMPAPGVFKDPSTKMRAPSKKTYMREMGGDIPLNSNTFQVKGNPNQTDSEHYPSMNAKLDHNEVVVMNPNAAFVFSDKLGFAKLAAKHSKAIGKAENDNSPEGKATKNHSEAIIQYLATVQEDLAKKVGLREGSTTSYYKGGPLPYPKFNTRAFQNFANKKGYKLEEDNVWGPKTEAAYSKLQNDYNAVLHYPEFGGDPTGEPYTGSDLAMEGTYPNMDELGADYTQEYTPKIESIMDQEKQFAENNLVPNDPNTSSTSVTPEQNLTYKTPWTIGDNFKVAELASKSLGLFRPSEVEKPNYDFSRITKQSYDPTRSLQELNSSFNNLRNGLQAGSVNTRRAALSSAYAQNINQQGRLLENYQNMNNQAQTQYEERLANQNRYNQQETSRINIINSQNRAAKDNAIQNFGSSLGQFGEDLNRKRYASDYVNLLRTQYPDIFNSFIKTI